MSDIETRLRAEYRDRTESAPAHNPARLNQVKARLNRDMARRRVVFGGAAVLVTASVAAVALVGGTPDTGNTPAPVPYGGAVSEPPRPAPTTPTPEELLDALPDAAPLPVDFAVGPLRPVADQFAEDRVKAVTGFAQAVACAWTSRYAAAPESAEGRLAVEELALSAEWEILQNIAENNDYPSRVQTISAELLRDDLRANWRSYLGCNTFPGNSNLR